MKKFISLLLCAVMVLGAASFAFADDTDGLLIMPAPAEGTNLLDKYEDVVVDSWYYDALYYCEQQGNRIRLQRFIPSERSYYKTVVCNSYLQICSDQGRRIHRILDVPSSI